MRYLFVLCLLALAGCATSGIGRHPDPATDPEAREAAVYDSLQALPPAQLTAEEARWMVAYQQRGQEQQARETRSNVNLLLFLFFVGIAAGGVILAL